MFAQIFKTEALSTTLRMLAEGQMLTANSNSSEECCQRI